MSDSSALFAMRPKPLLAHWVPGLAFVIITMLTLTSAAQVALFAFVRVYGGFGFGIIALAILSYVVGQVFDALRDVFEWIIYKLKRYDVEWYFFVKGEGRHVAAVEDWFFTYYILNFNLALCMIALNLVPWVALSKWERWASIGVAILFFFDAWILRGDLVELTNELTPKSS